MKRIKTETLERRSYIATIVAALVAIGTFIFGAYQFHETQKLQRETLELERETKAVELFIKYNELMRNAAAQSSREGRAVAFWRGNLSVAIAESIWNLTSGEPAWESTVKWMLLDQDQIERINDLDCATYNESFVEFVRRILGHEACSNG